MTKVKEWFDFIINYLPDFGLGIGTFILFLFISWLIKNIVIKKVKPRTKNPLLAVFIGKLAAFTVAILGFIFFLNLIGLGGIAKHIMAGAGITTFVIGFAFKDLGENFLSGIMMAFKSPFKIGDLIETSGIIGYVSELNMRDSVIKTLDGKDVFIPNAQILKIPLYNYTIDGFLRYEIIIGLDYSTDIERTLDIMKQVLSEIPEVLQGDKKPIIVVNDLASSTVNVTIFYWIDTIKSKSKSFHMNTKSKIIIRLLEELGKNSIYLPANIVELKNYNSEILITK